MLARRHNPLTPETDAMLRLWSAGLNTAEIADCLGLDEATVANTLHVVRERQRLLGSRRS